MQPVTLNRGARALEVVQSTRTTPKQTLPALCLHRAGASSRAWAPVLDTVGTSRRIVAVDLPGHGRSPGPPLTSIDAMAAAVAETADDLGLDRVVVVGHSMGGAVALTLALARPDLVDGLLLLATGARLRVATPLLDAVRDHFDALPKLMAPALFGPSMEPDEAERRLAGLFDAPAGVVATDLEACRGYDVEARLSELAIPLRGLVGSEDHLTPPRLMRRLAERVAGARLDVIEGVGHLLVQERPEVVISAVLEATTTRASVATYDMAGRAVRVTITDDDLAGALRDRSAGFELDGQPRPWLDAWIARGSETTDAAREKIRVEDIADGVLRVAGPRSLGVVRAGAPHLVVGDVADPFALAQMLSLALSVSLPREDALLLHADAVLWRGAAWVFLGPSGAGKSTAAAHMIERAGAERLAMDRTAVEVAADGAASVVTMPPLHHPELPPGSPRRVPLGGLVFPARGHPAAAPQRRDLTGVEALTRLLRSVIVPAGGGLPTAAALGVAAKLLETTTTTEIAWSQDQDLAGAMRDLREDD